MSKTATALLSFALGVLTTLWLSPAGNHTSIWAQEPGRTIGIGGGGVPVVPPISQHFADFGVAGPAMAFNVDGAECVRCKFDGPVLKYGGGNFQFTDFSFRGPVRVELTGAAFNTMLFLHFVQGLAAGQAPQQTAPNPPLMQTAMVKGTIKGSLGTIK